MALTDVYISEPLCAHADRIGKVGLLDVHVVGVEMNYEIGRAHLLDELECLLGSVDEVALVAVDRLDADRHACPLGPCCEPAE
jgi:hypothetical protein